MGTRTNLTPTGYWRLEDNKAAIGSDLTVSGSLTYAAGKFGNGIQGGLSSDADSLLVPSNEFSRTTFTVECWLNRTGTGQFGNVFGANSANDTFGIELHGTSSSYIALIFRMGSPTFTRVGHNWANQAALDADIPSGQNVHIAMSKDNSDGTVRCWIDNVEKAVTFLAGSAGNITGNSGTFPIQCGIGELTSGLSDSYGIVDNFKYYPYLKTDFSQRFYEGVDWAKKRRTS